VADGPDDFDERDVVDATGRPWPDGALERWLAELRAHDAAVGRGRVGSLERQAAEAATLLGVVIDLAERARPVMIDLVTGRRHRGEITLVGRDICAIRGAEGVNTLVATWAITAVRPLPGETPITGDRDVSSRATFATAVASSCEPGTRVALWCLGGEALTGEVESVGHDVIALRLDAGRTWAYVALASVAELSVAESG
jgi:hypothetical protein